MVINVEAKSSGGNEILTGIGVQTPFPIAGSRQIKNH